MRRAFIAGGIGIAVLPFEVIFALSAGMAFPFAFMALIGTVIALVAYAAPYEEESVKSEVSHQPAQS
jgi:hypothetical protein